MPVTNYYTVNGQIIGESTGGVRTSYMVDPLGSVIGTIDENANVVNTYRYKPYGALLAKTGSGADPANTWVGAWGYRQTGKRYSDAYVRARHYGSLQASWTSVRSHQLKDREAGYGYAFNSPVTYSDRSGNYPNSQRSQVPNPLSITVVTPGQFHGKCGAGTFKVRWHIAGKPSGWIVQHLSWSVSSKRCDTYEDLPPINPYPRILWEGWQVVEGTVYSGFQNQGLGDEDLFSWSDEAPNSFGTIAITAEVVFWPNYTLSVPPWDPTYLGTGGLPGIGTKPDGWPPGDTLQHLVSVTYNCCRSCKDPKKTIVTVPS